MPAENENRSPQWETSSPQEAAGAIATRRIGAAAFTVTMSTCAILLSVALDDFGVLGLNQHALTWQRGLGAALAVAGVALVSLF